MVCKYVIGEVDYWAKRHRNKIYKNDFKITKKERNADAVILVHQDNPRAIRMYQKQDLELLKIYQNTNYEVLQKKIVI